MAKYTSGREKELRVGLSSYSEDRTSVEVIGKVGINTTSATGQLDVVGHTELDSLNVSGISTFDTLGSTGLTTTRDLEVTGFSTFTNTIDANGNLDVDGHTELDELNVSGLSTFASNVDINASVDISTNLNVTGLSTFNNDVSFGSTATFGDDSKLKFGDGNDLEIYHNGNNSVIHNVGVGTLYIDSASDVIISEDNVTARRARFIQDGAVELFHDNVKTFQTVGSGISISSGTASTATIFGPSNIVIDPMPAGVGETSGNVYIKGDLYVEGTQFQVDSTTVNIADKVIGIATTCTSDVLLDGAGIGIGTDGNQKTWTYDNNNTALRSSENINVPSDKVYQIDGTEVLSSDQVLQKSLDTASTANTIVLRDASGNFSAGIITADLIGTASFASTAGIATYAETAGIATYATTAGIATYATTAGITTYATTAGIATYATTSGIATYAQTAGIATDLSRSVLAGSGLLDGGQLNADVTLNVGAGEGIAVSADAVEFKNAANLSSNKVLKWNDSATQLEDTTITDSGTQVSISTDVDVTGIVTATYFYGDGSNLNNVTAAATPGGSDGQVQYNDGGSSTTSGAAQLYYDDVNDRVGIHSSAPTVELDVVGTVKATSFEGLVSYATTAGIATYAETAGIATYATTTGIATYAETAGIATYATTAGIATYATTAGFSTSSGIATHIKGGSAGQLVYQSGSDTTAFFSNGTSGQALLSQGAGQPPVWGQAGLTGISIYDESILQGSAGQVTTLDFVGAGINASVVGTISTITVSGGYASTSGFSTTSGYATIAGFSTVAGIATYTSEFLFNADNTNNYKVSGPGLDAAGEYDPTLHLVRGQQYRFTNNLGAHPLQIETAAGVAYTDGIGGAGNGVTDGTLTFNVPFDAPGILYYQCTSHGNMRGQISIAEPGINVYEESSSVGTFTDLKFVGNNVTATGAGNTATITVSVPEQAYASNAGLATNIKGGGAGRVVYQSATDTTAFVDPTSAANGHVLLWNGSNPYWGSVTAASGSSSGITVQNEGTIVGTASSITQINFVGVNVDVTATTGASGIATVNITDNIGYAHTAGIATYAQTAGFTTTSGISTYTSEWTLSAGVGNTSYGMTGPGIVGTAYDPTIYLTRGQQYKFTNPIGAHPFQIQTVAGSAGVANTYYDGVDGNGVTNGTLTFNVPFNAPAVLYYQCTVHPNMGGTIYLTDQDAAYAANAGLASSATKAKVTVSSALVGGNYEKSRFVFIQDQSVTGYHDLYTESPSNTAYYAVGTNTIYANFNGSLTGTASTASFATTAYSLNGTVEANLNVAFAATSGFSTIAGYAHTAGVSTSAGYAHTAGISTTVTITGETSSATQHYLYFGGQATGGGSLKADSDKLLYTPSTGKLEVGSAVTVFGDSGIVSATSYYGSASNMTGLTGASAATYGTSTKIPQIVVDASGRITGITEVNSAGGAGGAGGLNFYHDLTSVGFSSELSFDGGLNVVAVGDTIRVSVDEIPITATEISPADADAYPVLVGLSQTGHQAPFIDSSVLKYNTETNTLTTTNLVVDSINGASDGIGINTTTVYGAHVAIGDTTDPVGIHTALSHTVYRSVDYTIQVTQGNDYHMAKVLTIHNGTVAYHNEYSTLYDNESLVDFDVDLSGGNIRLLATAGAATTATYVINFIATKDI